MGDESRLERVALNIPARSLNDERSASPSSLQHRLRQGDLLKRSDVRSLCHLPALANDNMMLHTYAGVEEDMHGGHIDVTVQSLAEGLRHCPQAVHIFVSWMLPFKDDAMETTRLAALQELGASCWLPDGMEDYERQRSFSCGSPVPENSLSRTPPLHTRPRSCNSKTSGTRMESWVEMLEKDTYSDFKGNLEGYKWPPVMHTLFNGSTRRLLQGKPEDDFASTLYRKGGPREAIQRWILVRLFLPLHPSPSSAAQTGASPSMLDHVGAGHLAGGCTVMGKPCAARFLPVATAAVVQGIWVEEVGAASLAKTLITVRQRERLCFRYVSNPIAMFALDGRCVYQNPESMKLHGDLRDHRHNSTASGALDAELAELWLDDEEEDSETDEEWAWTCAGETMDALHDAIFRGNSRLYEEMKRRTLEGREQYSCEIRSTDPRQRRVVWHRVVSTWARDPLTGEACVVVTETDITDKKQLERELHLHRSGQTAHDQEITDKIWDLRERFGILQDEGFVLGGERIPKRLRRESLVFLRRSQLESAARMALRMPFAATAFDAFVFCIKDAVVRSEADQSAVSPYAKVCEWVLEVAQRLVAPPAQSELRTEQDGSAESEEERQRWDYFAESVLALRIWEEPSMLPRLHAAVETTLQDLGTACRRRADAMKSEVQGGYLASHRLLMDIAPSLSQNLPRQDDPKVRAIRATAEDRMEMFMAARQSAQGRLKPDKAAVQDEEVFAHQLHKRARLLNAGFQRKVFQVLKRLSSFNSNNHSEPSSEPSTPLASAQSSEGRGSPSFSGRTSSASDHAATFAVDDKRRAFQRTLSLDPTNRKWSLNSSCSSRGESPPSRGLHVLGERRQVHRRASDLGMWMHTTQHPHPSDADTPSSVSPLLSAHRRELTTADEEHSECDAASKEADADGDDDDDGDDKKEEEDDVVLGTSLTPSAALSALMAGEFHHQHDDADDTQPWMDRSTHAGRTPSSRPRAAIAQLEVAAMARRGIALLAAEERSVDDNPVSVRCVFDSCTEMHTEITRRHKALDLHLIDANFLPSTRTATLDANSHQRRARLALNLHFPLSTELSGLNDGSEAEGEGGEYHRRVAPQLLELATVFFSDIVGFTKLSASLPPQKVSDMLNRLYNLFDSISLSLNISKIDTIGDAYMAVTNLRNDQASDHALRMARFAAEAIQAANQTFVDEDAPERGTVSIRAGLHTGPIVASVVGTTNPKYTVFGDAVNTASRMESTSIANRIQCSEATALLIREQLAASSLGQGLVVTERGEQLIKGKGSMKTFWVKASASVELHMGPVKTVRRMLDTLATHHQTHHQAEHWPLSARILDPVRCSVVVAGPQGLIRVLHWLLKSPDLQVVHVRNAFALPASAEQYGSRHVTVHVIYGQHGGGEGGDGRPRSLKIIGEIQLHDAAMHVIRTKMAALQAVTSATSAEDMAIKCKDILRSQEAPALSTFSY